MPVVSVIIPNYGGRHLLQKHLPDVLACMQTGDEIIIVDDASPDDSVVWLVEQFAARKVNPNTYAGTWEQGAHSGAVVIIANTTNQRFAVSANIGATHATGEYLFLLNTDVSPLATCRDRLVAAFTNDAVFAVGCLEYEQSVGGAKSGKNRLWFERGLFFHAKAGTMQSGSTAWVSGGSGMFRRRIWQELGGFDVAFAPAYWEDIDLSHRARKAGYAILFCEDAVVLHQHETTNSQTFTKAALLHMSWRSADLFTRKHATTSELLQYYLWRPFWWWQRAKALITLHLSRRSMQ